MGATAIGTGLNSPPGYADLVTQKLAQVSGLPVCKAADLVEATQDSGAFVQMSATMKRAAVQISKICNDLRWLSSGPRCGLYEMTLPPMQPGSSIMPGKVNPVIPEVINQICFQIIGYDAVVSMAAEASELELNMAEPVIAFDLLHGLMLLKNACIILTSRCIVGIQANRERCRQYVENSIGLVTALNPVLGYEKSAAIAKEALETNGSVYDLVLQKGWLTQEALDDILKPENMTAPRQLPSSMREPRRGRGIHMPSQQVYLIRHGETEWSLSGQHTGTTDIPLTENGRRVARLLQPVLTKETFTLVLTSPLQRARGDLRVGGARRER